MLKKLAILPLALLAAVSFSSPALACGDKTCTECETPAAAAPAPKAVKGELVTATYAVSGLKCGKCVNAVNHKLSEVAGVSKVDTNLAKHTVTVTHAKGKTTLANLQTALGDHFTLSAVTTKPAAAKAGEACCEEGGAEACDDKAKKDHHAKPAAPKK